MLNKVTFFIICFACSVPLLQGQEWRDLGDAGAQLTEIRQSFDQAWEGREYERGNGWKQFKRWEWFIEQRTWNGDVLDKQAYWKATQMLAQHRKTDQRTSMTWTSLGPGTWVNGNDGYNPGNGRINAVTEDPQNANVLYVGAPAGGLWKSNNGGNTWAVLSDDFASLGVSAIVVDPEDSNTIYIGTGDGDGFDTYSIGVLKSTDGGSTWNPTGTLTGGSWVVRKMVIDPSDTDILFAATSSGLFRTSNGGTAWSLIMPGSFHDVKLHPTQPDTMYVCNDVFYRSVNGGNTFTEIDTSAGLGDPDDINRMRIAVSPDEPDWVYVLAGSQGDSSFEGLWRSTDVGATFTLQSDSPNVFNYSSSGSGGGGQSWYDMALAVDPNDAEVIYTGGINVWKSTDAGVTLNIITQWVYGNGFGYVHADIHDLVMVDDRLYVGSDGGVFKSVNDGGDFTDLSPGLEIMQFYRLGGTPQNAGMLIGGTQDNGTNILSSGIWTHGYGADGMEAVIDYTNSNTLYMTYQGGGIQKSVDGGSNFFGINPGGLDGAWVTPYQMHPTNPSTLFIGYDNVWKTTNGGSNWTMLTAINGSKLNDLELANCDPDYIYVSDNGTLYRTKNGGSGWTTVGGLPGSYITDIEVHQVDPEQLWLTFSGTSANRVYYSDNAGDTWSNYSTGLPNIPVNTVVREEFTDNRLYVGTDVGVYYRDATMNQWEPYVAGLPNVIVSELEIHQPSGKLRAATYGRGMWEVPLVNSPVPVQLYVAGDAIGTLTGLSWDNAYTDLEKCFLHAQALGAPVNIWIKEGTYTPDETSRNNSIILPQGVTLIGGFEGIETDTSQRDVAMHPVVLSGDIGAQGVDSDNSYTVVKIQSGITANLIDLVISDGQANHPNQTFRRRGGGLRCLGSGLLSNLTFTNCHAEEQGAAMFFTGPGNVILGNISISGSTGSTPVNVVNGKIVVLQGDKIIEN